MEYTKYLLFSEYLIDMFREKQDQNRSFSIRSFSKYLGYKNPTLLNDILRKKRKPTIEIALRLSHKFSFPKHKADYLIKICEFERAKSTRERDLIMTELRKLLSQRKWESLDINQHNLANQPHILLVYNMIALKGFKPEAAHLNRRSRLKLTQKQLDEALETLVRLKCIRKDTQGCYKFFHEQSVLTANSYGSNSETLDLFHQHMMKMIQAALKKLPSHERDMRSVILPIRKEDLKNIIDEVTHAHQKAATYAVDSGADDVYILSTQLVPFSEALE